MNCPCCGRAPSTQRTAVHCCDKAFYCSADCRDLHVDVHAPVCMRRQETVRAAQQAVAASLQQDNSSLPVISMQTLADTAASNNNDGDDGNSKTQRRWIAAQGLVFDVTDSEFYTPPHGPYAILVGKDASMALGKMALKEEYLLNKNAMHWSRDLNPKELKVLQGWVDKFQAKYPVVGHLQQEYE